MNLILGNNLEKMPGIQSNSPFICETSQLQNQTQQRRTYLGKPLCRWQALCIPVETLAKRRWLMSNGVAEGWMEPASLGEVSMCQRDMRLYLQHLHWHPSPAFLPLALHQSPLDRISYRLHHPAA
jgi:hypothetical protein